MTPTSYIISTTTSGDGMKILLAIFNIAGVGQAIYSESRNDIRRSLWLIPKGKKTQSEVTAELMSEPGTHNAFVIGLNNPLTEPEIQEVRKFLTDFGWNTSEVSNEDLLLYFNAILQKQYNYYIDFDKSEGSSNKIRIKPIQDHPQFSSERLQRKTQYKAYPEDKVFTIEDFEVVHEVFEETIELDDEDETMSPSDDQK